MTVGQRGDRIAIRGDLGRLLQGLALVLGVPEGGSQLEPLALALFLIAVDAVATCGSHVGETEQLLDRGRKLHAAAFTDVDRLAIQRVEVTALVADLDAVLHETFGGRPFGFDREDGFDNLITQTFVVDVRTWAELGDRQESRARQVLVVAPVARLPGMKAESGNLGKLYPGRKPSLAK